MLPSLVLIICSVALWAAAGLLRRTDRDSRILLRGALVGKILLIAFVGLVFVNYMSGEEREKKMLVVCFAFYLVMSVLLLLSGRIRNRYKRLPNMTGILALITPLCSFFLIEFVFNDKLRQMEPSLIVQNVVYIAILFLLVFCALPWKRFAVGSFWICSLIFGSMNYYLKLFRGNPFMPTDLFAVGTALDVAGGYKFEVTGKILSGVLLCFACITLLCLSPRGRKTETTGKKMWAKVILNLTIAVVCLNYVVFTDMEKAYDVKTKVWMWNVSKAYNTTGSVLNFANLVRKSRVVRPKDYDIKDTNELLEAYMPADDGDSSNYPTVIGVMIESFSDLRALGDFEVPENYLENWYGRTDYLYRGNCYVSVYGGNTANSEFEFLTGNSLGAMPSSLVVYQCFNLENVGNLASILVEQGYQRTAFHPERKKNWNRERVYEDFGFERFLDKNDVENPVYLRKRITDACDFEKLIELYEENRGQKQFLFNVTLQDHGGYNIKSMKDQELVQPKEGWEEYNDVITYLTLLRETDKAIEQLISYFENVDEPVILCLFGDHQPSVAQEWRESLLGKPESDLSLQEMQKKYATPYLIWANYDTGLEPQETDLSANYLGALLLDAAGIPGSAYTNFLLDLRQHVPAINAFGYMTEDGTWHSMDEETEVSEWIDKYLNVEYNAMFDSGRNMDYYR